jgi:hypothetical protein
VHEKTVFFVKYFYQANSRYEAAQGHPFHEVVSTDQNARDCKSVHKAANYQVSLM